MFPVVLCFVLKTIRCSEHYASKFLTMFLILFLLRYASLFPQKADGVGCTVLRCTLYLAPATEPFEQTKPFIEGNQRPEYCKSFHLLKAVQNENYDKFTFAGFFYSHRNASFFLFFYR